MRLEEFATQKTQHLLQSAGNHDAHSFSFGQLQTSSFTNKLYPNIMAEAKEATSTAPDLQSMDRSVEISPMPFEAQFCNVIFCPLNVVCGWQTVNQREVVISEYCGVITQVRDIPGLYQQPCCGLAERRVTTAIQSLDLPNTKIVDLNGSPLMVSAIVNYQVEVPLKAIYNVEHYTKYVEINAQAVVKSVIGQHSYNDLKAETEAVNDQLCKDMQPKVDCTGVRILSVALNELNYAPEIAGSMLKKQTAGAMVEARQLIVQGAVQIAQDAVVALEEGGKMKLSNEDKVKIVTNLLTVTCSDTDATPTVSV
jgi:regulator of protease activity HflC (stomatin/prohibitin superfamily)